VTARRTGSAGNALGLRKSLAAAGLLVAAEGATGPDAKLIQACEECLSARASADTYWHGAQAPRLEKATRVDMRAQAMAANTRRGELEAWIIATPARTVEGASAKIRCALDGMGEKRTGNIFTFPRAVMEDALRHLG